MKTQAPSPTLSPSPPASPSSTAPAASAATKVALAEALHTQLLTQCTPGAADERLLAQLAAEAAATAISIERTNARLAMLVPTVVDDARKALAVSRILVALTGVGNALAKRAQGALLACSTLRVQRRLQEARR